ncbi:HNH endonuclease signature motif containing protein [Streptomyces sp. NPDC096198]|uniref:HNH endonuclease signature motif containing protein n=1 Tax=Streptomyces sp. NPDC096198 TaxID=3366080 RepID=UPI0037F5A071
MTPLVRDMDEEGVARRHMERAIKAGACLFHPASNSQRYATISYKGKRHKAHRFVYAALIAPLDAGEVVHHKCANKRCINPEHLQAVSTMENAAEMMQRHYYLKRIEALEDENRKLKKLVSV